MPLSAAKPTLETQIVDAYKKVKAAAMIKDADPDKIIEDLAKDLTTAIHAYVLQAQVTVMPGQTVNTVVATAVTPAFIGAGTGSGATATPGTGTLS